MSYKIPVFLSYPKPYLKRQDQFIEKLKSVLDNQGFLARTLGVTDYDMEEPLTAIRRLMLECNGIITVGFRRTLIKDGVVKPDSDIEDTATILKDTWITSPYSHIEPAMAFQICLY